MRFDEGGLSLLNRDLAGVSVQGSPVGAQGASGDAQGSPAAAVDTNFGGVSAGSGAAHDAIGGAVGPFPRLTVPVSLQRIARTMDPLSAVGGQEFTLLLPRRIDGVSKFYLGIDRVRQHLQVVAAALSSRSLPAQLMGVVLEPDGTAGRLLQVQFDPASVGSNGPQATVVTKNDGSFTLRLPQGAALPDSGLPLTIHAGNGNAPVIIPAAQIAANGVCGSILLPSMLTPLHVSILNALTALLPAAPPSSTPSQTTAPQLHVVKLGEDDSCQLSFKANNAVDKFPYGIFFRLVEPQTSIPHMAMRVPSMRGYHPIPYYQNADALADGTATYIDRIPVEQPLSVDGFRDQIMGITQDGIVTANETVPMAGTLGLGYTLWLSQRWTFQGLGLGDLVYSLALAPGEQQQIAIFERVDTATVKESEFFSEEETESQAARSDTSTQATFNSAFNEGVNAGSQFSASASSSSWAAGGGFSIGIVSAGGGGGGGSSESSGQTTQWLQGQRNTTQQAAQSTHSAAERQASARRSAMRTSMRTATASESESVTTKVITNHNHTRALTLQYWEVQRLYDVSTAVDGLTLTCLVPMQVVRFLPPGQALTLSDTGTVSNRPLVMLRYSSIIKHADVLTRALPRRFQYGLTLLLQFAADPTAGVEPFGGVAEDVVQFTLLGSFLPCEDVYITAVTKRNTRVGPVKLANSAQIPADRFASREELLAWLSSYRQNSFVPLTGSLALPPSLNRSDIVGFEFSRRFRVVDYTLLSPEMAALKAVNGLFSGPPPAWFNAGPFQLNGSSASSLTSSTIQLTPGDLEAALGGPFLNHFQAAIQELDAQGNLSAGTKGETYANDSLNGVELPSQPYPVPAIQIGPVLRFNQILEIEKMVQHVMRNTVQYSKAVWSSMSPDERAILLEHYTIGVPSDGIADESQMVPLLNCVENRVLGFFGNSMMLPFMIPQAVSEQMGIDPAQLQASLLAYQQETFAAPQSTIALPTRGVLGEAVLGHCASAEKIDLTRFWNWADAPADTAPTISPVTLPTTSPSIAAGLTASNSLTNLPPLINNVLNAPTPDTSLLQALSKSAASQQDFSPDFTGAKQLAGLITNAQNTANAARADALSANTKLVSQAMTTAASLMSSNQSGSQGQPAQSSGKSGQSQEGAGAFSNKVETSGAGGVGGANTPKQISGSGALPASEEGNSESQQGSLSPQLQQVGDSYQVPAYTKHELAAIVGEILASDTLKALNFTVFTDWKKHVSATGFDMAAYNPAEKCLWIVDNKAQFSGIGNANALTGDAFIQYRAKLRLFLLEQWPNAAEAKLAIEALDAGRIKLVVSNGFAGEATRFTKGLFDKGLHAFDVRLGKLYYPAGTPVTPTTPGHAEWVAEFDKLPKRKGVRIGKRGVVSVGPMLLAMATIGAAVYLLRSGAEFRQVAGEIAANLALDVVLSKLPGGFIASLVMGLESDNKPLIDARKLSEDVDRMLEVLPDVKSFSPADLQSTRDALKELIQNPIAIPEKEEPPSLHLPGLTWPDKPKADWA
jgi:hypothetical protein